MHILITGGAGALGSNLALRLGKEDGHTITYWDTVVNGVDVGDWQHVHRAAKAIQKLDILINCAGIGLVEWFEDIDPSDFKRVMDVNCNGIINCTQALLPLLRYGGTVCNIISNAAHVPMTASLAYNTSKAAAAMVTRQLAHELGPRHGVTVFGVSPNKLAGDLNRYTASRVAQVRGWKPEEVTQYQAAALPAKAETPIPIVAEFISFLLTKKERHRYLHGCIIPYGGP
jgi:NAD(P)-dependent dehydrogenase (short-subunit alcohol dehydrogenase family)